MVESGQGGGEVAEEFTQGPSPLHSVFSFNIEPALKLQVRAPEAGTIPQQDTMSGNLDLTAGFQRDR